MISEGVRPCRRELGLVCEPIGEELLAFDTERARAHSLNSTAAQVWQACDGTRDLDTLAADCGLDPGTVALALQRLSGAHLLEEASAPTGAIAPVAPNAPGVSRRIMLRRSLAAGAGLGVAIPVIRSITAPTLAMAASNGRVKGKAGQHCSATSQCSPPSVSHCDVALHSCQRARNASCSHTSSCSHGGGATLVCHNHTCTFCSSNGQCPGSLPNCNGGFCQ